METVKPAGLPAVLDVSVKGACAALGPEDGLDDKAKSGQLSPEEQKAVARRRDAIVAAAIRCAKAAGVGDSTLEQLAKLKPTQVDEWLAKAGLTTALGDTVRPNLGNEARKACYYACLAIKAEYPSRAAAMLRQVANAAGRAAEISQGREGGAAHSYLVGLIGAGVA